MKRFLTMLSITAFFWPFWYQYTQPRVMQQQTGQKTATQVAPRCCAGGCCRFASAPQRPAADLPKPPAKIAGDAAPVNLK